MILHPIVDSRGSMTLYNSNPCKFSIKSLEIFCKLFDTNKSIDWMHKSAIANNKMCQKANKSTRTNVIIRLLITANRYYCRYECRTVTVIYTFRSLGAFLCEPLKLFLWFNCLILSFPQFSSWHIIFSTFKSALNRFTEQFEQAYIIYQFIWMPKLSMMLSLLLLLIFYPFRHE